MKSKNEREANSVLHLTKNQQNKKSFVEDFLSLIEKNDNSMIKDRDKRGSEIDLC